MKERSFMNKVNDFAFTANNVVKVLTSTLCLVYVSTLIGIAIADLKRNNK